MDRPSCGHYAAIGLTARVARDSAFWPARYLDRNKFTLNYLLRYGPGRSFGTSRPRAFPLSTPPSLSRCAVSAEPPRPPFRTVRFVVRADFNFPILRSPHCATLILSVP